MNFVGFSARFLAQLHFAGELDARDSGPIRHWSHFCCYLLICVFTPALLGLGDRICILGKWSSGQALLAGQVWGGSCCQQLSSEGNVIDCTASPAVPCMRHSLSWPPLGSFFPLHPPCNEALIKIKEFPGCLLRHLGFLSFFLSFLVGCKPQWKGEEGEIKRKAGAKVCSFVFPSLSKSKFRGVW